MNVDGARANLTRREILAGGAGAASVLLLGTAPDERDTRMRAFVGARVIDGTGNAPIDAAAVLVSAGRVVALGPAASVPVPDGAERIDLRGKFVMPMLIDAHVHVGTVEGTQTSPDLYTPAAIENDLRTFQRFGIGAVLVMGTDRTPLPRAATARTAQMRSGGAGFGVEGGLPPPVMVGAPWIARPATPEAARATVRALAERQPDIVKLWVDGSFGKYPVMDRAISAAIIDEAHRAGLRAAAHVFALDDARALVEQGLDVLAHSVRDREIDDAFLERLRARNVAYVTTLALDESQYVYADTPPPAFTSDPAFRAALAPGVGERLASPAYRAMKQRDPETILWQAAARMSKHNALRVLRAGVTVALGTDAGATFERIRGFDTHRELELLVRSGFTPLEAIRSATVAAASVLGPRAGEIGPLAPGMRANLLVLADDPTLDITATRRMESIWQNGSRVASWREVS